ncbi:hypothetical protein [Leptotrichia sp. oral taxon 879]|uniref:hypothetical protein n=1 Tax=Leptotrichia sp. oral taxon 879 TaxID=1227267 RepID=UPI0003ADD386|nr:hypothetical protein [Leptotrichia sp. oral taxon 879]ERK48810.1 hypothetical protein HMPREF1552_01933 [Leptotrichia sp. oral taxon 879 str. F0557]
MKNIFKILILILVGVSMASCELFSPSQEYNQSRKERGRECYKYPSGNVYCEDTK